MAVTYMAVTYKRTQDWINYKYLKTIQIHKLDSTTSFICYHSNVFGNGSINIMLLKFPTHKKIISNAEMKA